MYLVIQFLYYEAFIVVIELKNLAALLIIEVTRAMKNDYKNYDLCRRPLHLCLFVICCNHVDITLQNQKTFVSYLIIF